MRISDWSSDVCSSDLSNGGGFTIRGFGADRISQTLDGLPLNDSGNYALYTNQQVDPEILEQVSVNLGVTDVDSPTASAVGGTINIRTRVPSDERSEEHTSELQSLMRISYAVFCLKKKKTYRVNPQRS